MKNEEQGRRQRQPPEERHRRESPEARELKRIADALEDRSVLAEIRHDQRWLVDATKELREQQKGLVQAIEELGDLITTEPGMTAPRPVIHVVAVELKENHMPTIDHMPDMQLPSASVRAKLSVHNPRKADGSRAESPTWATSDESQLPLQAIEDSNVQVADPSWVDPGDGSVAPLIDEVDATDGLPNKVYSTFANTPLDEGSGTVTFRASGVADCDIKIKYNDPPVGHVAIVGVEAVEE